MRDLSSIPRPRLLAAASVFALWVVVYTGVWVYYAGWTPPVTTGIEWKPEFTPYVTLSRVPPDTPAERAGLRENDRILSVNGYPQHVLAVSPAIAHGKPGDVVTLRVQRPGTPEPFDVRVTLEPAHPRERPTPVQWLALQVIDYYPLPFLVVGLLVLFLRVEDRNAWLLALMFAGFIAAAPVAFLEGVLTPGLRRLMLTFMLVFYGMLPAIFFWFFATFPTSSPIDKRLPQIKWVFLVAGLVTSLPVAAIALITGSSLLVVDLLHRIGDRPFLFGSALYSYGGFGLGLASLLWNSMRAPTPNDRRKTRVMLWGTIIGTGPVLLIGLVAFVEHKVYYSFPFWVVVLPIIALGILPVSFAYAVVKYRALEIPVLLKRSARYFLVQRGYVVLLFAVAAIAIAVFTRTISRLFPEGTNIGMITSAVFGVVLVWVSAPMVKRGTERIDRAFFRSSYDTRQILIDLADKARSASTREELAQLLQQQLQDALHPSALAIYFRQSEGAFATSADVPENLQSLSGNLPVLRHMQERGQTWEIVPDTGDAPALSILQPLLPECLVPMLGRHGKLLGLAVFGPKLSEESYSGEDKRLLDSVANQTGIALENFELAESMAERLEAEHRARQEMDIARQVQSKLLPQKAPLLKTIDYAGTCIQARAVGGDYYDFLDLGEGRVGFVLADVAGKGISAALLMANLQAHLRSQSAIVSHDFAETLEKVNRLFYESTEPNNYATLFIGVYEDSTRRLRYVNCGHNPPVIVRGDSLQRLTATSTVLGLFEEWRCQVAETLICPGDILAICTDGVFEAADANGSEFGEEGLVAAIQAGKNCCAQELLQSVVARVKDFAPGEQADDITLLVARAKE